MALVRAVAVVDRDNSPLYFESQSPDTDMRLESLLFACLDMVDDKREQKDSTEPFLGSLYPIEDMRTYGYLASNGITFLLAVDAFQTKEKDLRALCQQLHNAYSEVVCNPFFQPSRTALADSHFHVAVRTIMNQA